MVLADVSTVYSLGEADSFMVDAVQVNSTLSNNATTSVPLNTSKLPEQLNVLAAPVFWEYVFVTFVCAFSLLWEIEVQIVEEN